VREVEKSGLHTNKQPQPLDGVNQADASKVSGEVVNGCINIASAKVIDPRKIETLPRPPADAAIDGVSAWATRPNSTTNNGWVKNHPTLL
jgi:hypothetical protein